MSRQQIKFVQVLLVMESILDIFKIGIGPSSSHTMGPWKAALSFRKEIGALSSSSLDHYIQVDLYGSLALTGKGHGTDFAIFMGLMGFSISDIDDESIQHNLGHYLELQSIQLESCSVRFSTENHINFWTEESLAFHSNGMKFRLINAHDELLLTKTYYSIGGGFIVDEDDHVEQNESEKDPFFSTSFLSQLHEETGKSLHEIIRDRELKITTEFEISNFLSEVFSVMLEAAFLGCHKDGVLPGGLGVKRRAKAIHDKLLNREDYRNSSEWLDQIRADKYDFKETLEWINCFALAVNEQNAAFGRVVTAPTNGASGVIPSVLLYILTQLNLGSDKEVTDEFLLVSGLIGMLYKHGATLSAAAGGCQAEIGVSASMAAGGLAAVQGGSIDQIFMAAEIAMEHHLGLTCDPIQGLVQVPCIERNSIGAIKAISSAQLALVSEPSQAKVSLEQVIQSMWETAKDMNHKYKETSLGGLAVNVLLPEC